LINEGEACRLVAWMIKHSHSAQVMECLVKAQLTPHLVSMVASEHAVMQNEALLALTLISTSCKGWCFVIELPPTLTYIYTQILPIHTQNI
jgi:hypothetical protein